MQSSIDSQNRGPLTTIYTPPSTCLDAVTLSSGTSGSYWLFKGHYNWGDASCYPPSIAKSDGTELWGQYYYSPGICPSGWSIATTQETSPAGLETTLASTVTAALCCPSGWYAYGGVETDWTSHGCTTAWPSGWTLPSVWDAPTTYDFDVHFSNPADKSFEPYVLDGDASAICDGIPVMWQNTDTQVLDLLGQYTSTTTTSSSSSTTSAAPTSPTTSIPTATSTSSSNVTAGSSSGLSTGAKAGIGVAIPLAVLALLAAIFFYIRRRKQQQRIVANNPAYNNALEQPDTYQAVPTAYQEGGYLGQQNRFQGAPAMQQYGSHYPEPEPQEVDALREAQELHSSPRAVRTVPLSYHNREPLGSQQAEHSQPGTEPLLRPSSEEAPSPTPSPRLSILTQLKSPPGTQLRINELRALIGRVRAEGFELTEAQMSDLEELELELRNEVMTLQKQR